MSLERRKFYATIADSDARKHGQLRVIDESGEDYLYPAEFFVAIELPQAVHRALRAAVSVVVMYIITTMRRKIVISAASEKCLRQRQELERDPLPHRQNLDGLASAAARFKRGRQLLSFRNSVASRFETGDGQARRLGFESVGSNLTREDRELSIDTEKRFGRWAEPANISSMRR